MVESGHTVCKDLGVSTFCFLPLVSEPDVAYFSAVLESSSSYRIPVRFGWVLFFYCGENGFLFFLKKG